MKTLLAIDGGGLFGIGVANWMPKLKNWKFDYYAGTSVGAILAASYASGIAPLKVQEMFNGNLPKRIFTKPGFPWNLNPLRCSTYDNKEVKKVLLEVFGDTKVKDVKFPLIIVAWNYDKRKQKVFTNINNKNECSNGNYLLRDAVLASMSAPTYFPIAEIREHANAPVENLGDGGVCGNDPSLAGIAAMQDDGIKIEDIKCLSICTGGDPKEKKLKMFSKAGWLPVVVDIITLGNVGYTSYCVKRILDDRYCRVAPCTLPDGSMDDFSLVPKIKEVWETHNHLEACKFLNS
jgi:patatin-like phospholipase/acyl hydrolase